MGDDFVRYGFPFIDVASGGSVQGMIDAMEKAAAQLPADAKVIPATRDLQPRRRRAFTKMLKETSAVVQKPSTITRHWTDEAGKILAPWQNGKAISSTKMVYRDALQFAHRPQRRICKAQLGRIIEAALRCLRRLF